MDRIKITQLIAPIDNYGKERWLLTFLKYLDKTGFSPEVVIFSASGRSPFAEHVKSMEIPCKILAGSGKINISDIRKLRAHIRQNSTAILHSNDYKSDIFALWGSFGLQIKRVSTPHGWCGEGDAKLAFYEKIDRFFLRYFDKVAPLSEKMALSLREIPGRKLTVISNFIDLDRMPEPEEGDPNLITFMGRLVELKRVQDAIRAVNLSDNKKLRLQIIGDGPMREELESLARELGLSERVDFMGHRGDSLELLNRSKIFILPSLTEGISRSVMEAMAMKRIIISTDIPGINELIRHGENGYLVETRNPKALAGMIDDVFNDMDRAMAIAERARETVEKRHSAVRIVKDYEKLYQRLLK